MALVTNPAAHGPNHSELRPDVDLYDVQRLPRDRDHRRRRTGILRVRMEESGDCRHKRTLSLTSILLFAPPPPTLSRSSATINSITVQHPLKHMLLRRS